MRFPFGIYALKCTAEFGTTDFTVLTFVKHHVLVDKDCYFVPALL